MRALVRAVGADRDRGRDRVGGSPLWPRLGGPLIFVSAIAVLLGAYEQDGLHALFSLPEFAFELAFAIYLIVKGFRPSPILDDARFAGGDGGSRRPAAAP